MSCRTYCPLCSNVAPCVHTERVQELLRTAESEAQRESNPEYLMAEVERLCSIVYAEDYAARKGEPYHPIPEDEYRAAEARFNCFKDRHHELTRQPDCACHLCKEKGWYIPVPAALKPKKKSTLAPFLDGVKVGDESNCRCGCYCQVCCEGGCGATGGWECICNECMDEYERRAFGRRFYVIDGEGAVVVRDRELTDFLAEYPNAREVR